MVGVIGLTFPPRAGVLPKPKSSSCNISRCNPYEYIEGGDFHDTLSAVTDRIEKKIQHI
jgi:hypothetical protein